MGWTDSVMRIFAMMLPPLQAQAVGLAELQQLFVDRLRHLNTVCSIFFRLAAGAFAGQENFLHTIGLFQRLDLP